MKLIVGIGNPGSVYEGTYHNIGFMAVTKLADNMGASFDKAKFNSIYAEAKIKDEKVFIIKPLTYMNLSGEAVRAFASFYKIPPEDIIVFCDDIDIPKGEIRYREKGSGGTHNGLKNIVHNLSSENFKRIRIGAGNDKNMDLKDYVLSKIDEESLSLILPAIDKGIQKLMELF